MSSHNPSQPYGNGKSFTRFTKPLISTEVPDDFDATDYTAEEEEEDSRTAQAAADDFTMEDKGDSEDVLDRDPFEEAQAEIEGQDFWSLNGTCLVRHHRVPRTRLFSPYDLVEKKPPIPLDYVDLRRETYTSLESPKEAVILDTWWLPSSINNSTQPI